MKSIRCLYKKLLQYVPDKRIWAYSSMALSAAAVCSYMGAYWFLWQCIVSILVIPAYEKAMYDAIIVVALMILRGILNIASATCSHYLGFRLETNLRKNGLHKLLDASSSFFDHNSSGEIRKVIDDNAAETHKTVAHLIPDNITAVMTPVLMFVLMFAIDYRLGILLILITVIGVLQYRKMSGGTEFLSGYSAALQKMSAATVEYVRGMQIIKIFGVTVQYYKTLIDSIKEYKQYVYQYSLSCKNPYVGFQVLFNVFYAFAVPAAVVLISYGEPAMLILAKIVFFAVFSGAVFTSFTSIMFTGQDNFGAQNNAAKILALRNGEIDAILGSSRLSAEGYTEISQDTAFGHAMDDSTNQTRYLGMNLNKAPFNDPLVREAVSYAVNQQELETSVFDGLETAAETLFTNEKPNCGVEVKTYPTDMEKAKQLMKEAGYEDTNDDGILEKDGTSLAIHFNYSQSLASIDNAVLSIAASLKELGFDVTIDAVDMNTWYGALMAGEYDLTFYNTAGGSFDPATDMSNMAPGAMGDPILCQFSAFFENPEIFAELDSTSDSQRVQEIYGMILNGIADQNLLVPVTGTHDLALWNTDKITGYDFYTDASYVDIASVHVK
ncbi:MAG TPA: ABC transporter substrate-binding protein [Oscillospiraceae bacterium]|nr:ABC transporter substrate-binding protein [Oscillospiraceae bacterium]